MRDLNKIIIHCAATEQGRTYTVEDIRRWHKKRGFRDIGYHYVVYIDGHIERGRPIQEQGAHAKGFNEDSIGICYIGGLIDGKPADTRTVPQIHALRGLVEGLKVAFEIKEVVGHRDLTYDRECPCFDVKTQL